MPYAVSVEEYVLLASWIIHLLKPVLISVEAAASLRYEAAVMGLYRDQSTLYQPVNPIFFTLKHKIFTASTPIYL